MNIVILSSSKVGTRTNVAANSLSDIVEQRLTSEDTLIRLDLKTMDIQFSDGRHFEDYKDDTLRLTTALMSADVIFFAAPIFQASIPATLKNVFDLLPQDALQRKTASIVVTAGSSKHFLVAETQLKPILTYMKANTVPNYVFIEDRDIIMDQITSDDVSLRLENLVENTFVLAKTYQQIWQSEEEAYDF